MRKTSRRTDWQSGFTLVEMAVVLAVFSLLLAAGSWSLMGYYRYSEKKEQDACARVIYLAAQSGLTGISGDGQKARLRELFGEETEAGYEIPEIYYLEFWNGEEGQSREVDAFLQLTDPYLPDRTIFHGAAVCIAWNPWEERVYGVCYSRHCPDGFSFTENENEEFAETETLPAWKTGIYGGEVFREKIGSREASPES